MAALPPSSTERAFVKYRVNDIEHTMMVRVTEGTSDGTISEEISAFLEALDTATYNTVFVSFARSAIGSNVRVPATWGGLMEWGAGAAPTNGPSMYSFTGKDVEGHAFMVQLFGRSEDQTNKWRIYGVDNSNISNAVAAMVAATSCFITIGDRTPIYNNYANCAQNAYWQRQARK